MWDKIETADTCIAVVTTDVVGGFPTQGDSDRKPVWDGKVGGTVSDSIIIKTKNIFLFWLIVVYACKKFEGQKKYL